jgi:hypothetical protein
MHLARSGSAPPRAESDKGRQQSPPANTRNATQICADYEEERQMAVMKKKTAAKRSSSIPNAEAMLLAAVPMALLRVGPAIDVRRTPGENDYSFIRLRSV